jgi:putative membrane protein
MKKILTLAAACMLAGSAWAQQDNADNPHSTKNPNRQTSNVPSSETRQQTQAAESANPHATNNPNDASKPNDGKANVNAAETDNPHNTDNKDRRAGQSGMAMGSQAESGPVTADVVVQRLHVANLGEIAMGQLAQQNGSNPRVQQFGKTLVNDHQTNDKQLRDLAGKKSVTLSSTPADKMAQMEMKHSQKMHDQLSKLNGAEFDRAFARAMAEDHRKDIAHAQMWRTAVNDPQVTALLDQTVPVLQQHLRTAESLREPAAQGRSPQ